ncbi:hypothetical protein F5I97DRAFT_1809050 [Phlebopus sp. FC_14]|nr:hypothetical protein F5I97DRAFT_1809050 [Phlebopus sp. FC_14]
MSSRKAPPSRWSALKAHLPQHDLRLSLPSRRALRPGEDDHDGRLPPHSWSQWAGQKIRRNGSETPTIDEANLFPGWAMKRPRSESEEQQGAFDVVVHASGHATSRRAPDSITRSQRAFLKLARGFASLPKVQQSTSSRLDTDAVDMPGRQYLQEVSDHIALENLEQQFRISGISDNGVDEYPFFDSNQSSPRATPVSGNIPADLQRLHDNLESRLRPFWSSALSSRKIELSVFAQPVNLQANRHSTNSRPLLVREVWTGSDGFFSDTFPIPWRDICAHEMGRHIALGDTCLEHELLVEARVVGLEQNQVLHESLTKTIIIPITQSNLRVISDIDDTVKMSRILDGPRAVFQHVFVRDLEESVIPGMGEWYNDLWELGVRFHYVSNSPFELLPVIKQFLEISCLPQGSIRLRSYGGRSLFNGLLSSPAARKRASVIEILEHFRDSQFLLVGDSGEQDLELYASLAAERPQQIAGVFIRDVSGLALEDPTGDGAWNALTRSPKTPNTTLPSSRPTPKRAASDPETQSPTYSGSIWISGPDTTHPPSSFLLGGTPRSYGSPHISMDSSSSLGSVGSSTSSSLHSTRPVRRGTLPITEGEKKRWELQSRVRRARLTMPKHIVLRVFEHPRECVEAEELAERLVSTLRQSSN